MRTQAVDLSHRALCQMLQSLNLPERLLLPEETGTAADFLRAREEWEKAGLAEPDFDGTLHPQPRFARMLYVLTHVRGMLRLRRVPGQGETPGQKVSEQEALPEQPIPGQGETPEPPGTAGDMEIFVRGPVDLLWLARQEDGSWKMALRPLTEVLNRLLRIYREGASWQEAEGAPGDASESALPPVTEGAPGDAAAWEIATQLPGEREPLCSALAPENPGEALMRHLSRLFPADAAADAQGGTAGEAGMPEALAEEPLASAPQETGKRGEDHDSVAGSGSL